ncbi:DUF4270 domain-containing protein [Chryseobacterium sp. LC2016-29]|uniref:DUF4270 family protein n=1 Tax=Chryseobacterium sp. LC2016-29 TaxID=2897331 RepID=UPI001E2E7CDD|nr:DUF4270 family protein [Chryseobacterium sp. LC2016-29]MCD0480123.1 DUF4270 domain-containing protein [Chryseobacterium sp. LC2016-29]
MIYNIRKVFTILSVMVLGGVLVYNCEPEPDSLGEQLFLNGAAEGVESSYDLIAYNIKNNDTIRTDAFKLLDLISSGSTSSTAVLGAFNENQFGMQRASYFTQVRLAADNPDFGTNAVVDSVVLVLKPIYSKDSLIATTTDENYVYPYGNIDAKKVVTTYPIAKFGKAKKNLTLQVSEVKEFMNGYNDFVYSGKNFETEATFLGTKEITDGNVSSVVITKDSDNTQLFSSSAISTSPALRIKLSNALFQSKIIDKKGQPELSDVSNFIRHFKGLKVSVAESDGYLFQFSPNDMELIMYYKNDKLVDNVNTRPQTKYEFAVKGSNMHSAYYEYNRTGARINDFAFEDKTIGDKKLYAQGMGGYSIGIKFKKEEIDRLKKLYQDEKAAIISAKIRIYTDEIEWNNPYPKPGAQDFTIIQGNKKIVNGQVKETTEFTTDFTSLGAAFIPVRAYNTDKNPASYEFTVTRSLKDIVESTDTYKEYKDKYFKIDLAKFLQSASNPIAGYNYTSRAFSMGRTVFVGSDSSSDKKIKLLVTYGTKK